MKKVLPDRLIPVFYTDWNAHNLFHAMLEHRTEVTPIELNEFTAVIINNCIDLAQNLDLEVLPGSIDSCHVFAGCIYIDNREQGLRDHLEIP